LVDMGGPRARRADALAIDDHRRPGRHRSRATVGLLDGGDTVVEGEAGVGVAAKHGDGADGRGPHGPPVPPGAGGAAAEAEAGAGAGNGAGAVAGGEPDRRARRRATLRLHLGLAAVAYLPLLLTRPGWVSADTKTYLYLDPGQLIARARSMWDPSVGTGTVSHQRIGFLWPMGPYYWLCEAVGLPDWVAQRLWWGTIMFAAGAGVAYLVRTLGWRPGPGVTAATFTYALSPVILTLVARLSGVLLPFCALPWLVALTIRTVRHRSWRYPALFALFAVTFGSVNATGLLLVGVAPLLWLPYAVVGAREASVGRAALAGAKIGVLTLAVSAWWLAGLNVQRTHGLEITRYSETAQTVASASLSHEVLRGLGYWFFYGRDRLGPWIEPSRGYTQWVPLVALTYLVPLLGIGGAALARWRHRAYFVLLVLVGTALAVGAYPWDANAPFPHLVQRFQSTQAGLAMRSLPRAVPLVALGMAVLLGAGLTAMVQRWPRHRRPATIGAVALAVLALPPLWLGQFVPDNLRRPEDVPAHWREAAGYLDAHDDGTRVLVIPGSDFAAYDWGTTVDPILPGLMDRPSVQREAVPNGSPASANLLDAFDLTLQEGTADPDALAPMARLLRAGDVVVVGDWQYERNSVPEPGRFWDFAAGAPGFADPEGFGEAPGREGAGAGAGGEAGGVPAVGVLPLPEGARVPIVSTHPSSRPLLVAGDGAGLVDAAGVGLIDGSELIRYAATLDEDDVRAALDDDAVLLLTDSNRKRGERWNTLRHNRGSTETVDGGPLVADPNDNRLPLFPGEGTSSMTVVERHGGIGAEATSYGNAITYVPEQRPAMAVDGDPDTAWRTAAFEDARGERLELTTGRPITTDRITFHQPDEDASRSITEVRLRFSSDAGSAAGSDGDRGEVDVALSGASRDEAGQTVTFPERTFSRVSIEILADSAGSAPRWSGQSSVGFSEVELGGEPNVVDPRREVVRLPTDLLDAVGPAAVDHPLAVTLTRQRQDPADPARADEERSLVRAFDLPGPRAFSLAGTARLSPWADPEVTGALIGRPRDGSSAWAESSDRPTGAVISSAAQVFDGDPATAWTTDGGYLEGQWIEVGTPEPVTVDSLPLTVVADDQHSRPAEVTLSVDGEEVATVALPDLAGGDDGRATVDLDVPRVRGSAFRLELSEVDMREAPGSVYGDPPLPVAIAEIGLPGPTVPDLPRHLDTGCRDDLLTADGRPVPLRVRGTTADALAGRPLEITACGDRGVDGPDGPAGADLALRTENLLASTSGRISGIDVDQLVLRSAAGGGASTSDGPLVADPAGSPRVEVVSESAAEVRVHVSGATPGSPFWLVLGQSYNDGWAASVAGGDRALRPELVDGFANGWRLDPDAESFDVVLEFTPQRAVDVALWVSLLAGVVCVGLAFRRPRPVTMPASAAASAEPGAFTGGAAFEYRGTRPGALATTLVVAGMVTLGGVLAGTAVGVVTGLVTLVGCRHHRARAVVLAGGAGALALAAAYVVAIQLLHHPEPGLEWPYEMRRAHPLGWLAILLLTADLLLALAWRRPRAGVSRGR
jgi:arabinofuranan 3-O-arabinosyltransferase